VAAILARLRRSRVYARTRPRWHRRRLLNWVSRTRSRHSRHRKPRGGGGAEVMADIARRSGLGLYGGQQAMPRLAGLSGPQFETASSHRSRRCRLCPRMKALLCALVMPTRRDWPRDPHQYRRRSTATSTPSWPQSTNAMASACESATQGRPHLFTSWKIQRSLRTITLELRTPPTHLSKGPRRFRSTGSHSSHHQVVIGPRKKRINAYADLTPYAGIGPPGGEQIRKRPVSDDQATSKSCCKGT